MEKCILKDIVLGFTEIHNGHAYVDLGLRSGGNKILFATTNIGANSPEEVGDFFAWGEISKRYTGLEYGGQITGASNPFDLDHSPFLYEAGFATGLCSYDQWGDVEQEQYIDYYNKYTANGYYFAPTGEYSSGDGKTTLEPSDDVAHVLWGEGWRMPDDSDYDWLYANADSWVWTDNWNSTGVCGYIVSGRGEFAQNSIFIPITGYISDLDHFDASFMAGYWTRTVEVFPSPSAARYLYFDVNIDDNTLTISSSERFIGHSVRPVLEIPE